MNDLSVCIVDCVRGRENTCVSIFQYYMYIHVMTNKLIVIINSLMINMCKQKYLEIEYQSDYKLVRKVRLLLLKIS